jgi:hypothetical protein
MIRRQENRRVKVMSISTSPPVKGPSPPVNWFGAGLILFTTVFRTENGLFSIVAPKLSVAGAAPESRVAASISTSASELTRVTTRGVRAVFKSLGKT